MGNKYKEEQGFRCHVEGDDDCYDRVEIAHNEAIDRIVQDWGIDEDTATEIVHNDYLDEMDMNMFICEDGQVYSAENESVLKESILEHIKLGGYEEIGYVFINGNIVDVEIDIRFDKLESDEKEEGKAWEKQTEKDQKDIAQRRLSNANDRSDVRW